MRSIAMSVKVSLYVCLSVRISENNTLKLHEMSCTHAMRGRGSVFLGRQSNLLCTFAVLWMTSRLQIMEQIFRIIHRDPPGGANGGAKSAIDDCLVCCCNVATVFPHDLKHS